MELPDRFQDISLTQVTRILLEAGLNPYANVSPVARPDASEARQGESWPLRRDYFTLE